MDDQTRLEQLQMQEDGFRHPGVQNWLEERAQQLLDALEHNRSKRTWHVLKEVRRMQRVLEDIQSEIREIRESVLDTEEKE